MTSTPFNVGLNDGARLSSRVLRPPGGGHTDIFGGEPVPTRGRRPAPAAATAIAQSEEAPKATNGTEAPSQNGQKTPETPQAPEPTPEPKTENPKTENPRPEIAKPDIPKLDQPKAEPPKRVRVPPGGFSSGLCPKSRTSQTGANQSHRMEGGGRQSRLLGRLLGRLRGDHHKYATLDKHFSLTSTGMSESTTNEEEDANAPAHTSAAPSSSHIDHDQLAANIDLRYSGQYLTPEQLPEFCEQLHHLVEVIRNIQSYAKVTGEYPSDLERRLEQEAREVAALAAEARNARDVVARTRAQRRAVRAHRKQLVTQLASLKETEVRELESTVRLSDRKLFKSWESLKDSTDPSAFEPLLDEIKNKQTALECLVRLIESRKSSLARGITPSHPMPPPLPDDNDNDEESSATTVVSGGRKRQDGCRRAGYKRRRQDSVREPRSMPLSGEPSRHGPQPQTTDCVSRYRVGSAGAVTMTPFEFQAPSRGSTRDLVFFSANG